jgi:hypothetical protein
MNGSRGFVFKHLPIALAAVPPVFPHQCQRDLHPGHSDTGAGRSGSSDTAGSGTTGIVGGTSTRTAGGTTGTVGGASGSNSGGGNASGAAGTTAATGGLSGSGPSSVPPSCGNGVLDPGEVCDEGAANGSIDHCDATCAFACTGACPIRVDPAAATNGSGRDWAEPTQNLQAAIDQQVARGGGEVWVRAGEYALSVGSAGAAISVGSAVTLRGGFTGTEANVEQRRADQWTRLRGAGAGSAGTLLNIASAVGVVINRLTLIDGEPNFTISDSTGVVLTEVNTIWNGQDPTNTGLTIVNSDVRIERSNISMPRNFHGLELTGSDVAIKNSTIAAPTYPNPQGAGAIPRLYARDSRVLLEDARSTNGTIIGSDAEALVIRSTLLIQDQQSFGAALDVAGSAALVDDQLGMGFGSPQVYLAATGSVLAFASNFSGGRTTNAHGSYPEAWSIDGSGSLEVSLSSFGSGYCDYADASCEAVIPGNINNSRFTMPASAAVVNHELPASNCAEGISCTDTGNEALLADSHDRLMLFVAPFFEAPFHADLFGYSDPNFWRCNDANAPDPGYHPACTR